MLFGAVLTVCGVSACVMCVLSVLRILCVRRVSTCVNLSPLRALCASFPWSNTVFLLFTPLVPPVLFIFLRRRLRLFLGRRNRVRGETAEVQEVPVHRDE